VRVAGAGSPTTVSLHPEKVHLGPDADACPNRFEGEVRELIYLGDHTRLRLAALGQEEFVVKVAHTHGPPSLLPGDRIQLGFHVADCRALDRG
jgi:putative spermidine/putrescine transport system ATP-binding protein